MTEETNPCGLPGQFEDPLEGLVAAYRQLRAFAAAGARTPGGLAQRWCRLSGNDDPDTMAHVIAHTLGIAAITRCDFTAAGTMERSIEAIARCERGWGIADRYEEALIYEAIGRAMVDPS